MVGHKKQWEFLRKNFETNQLSHAYLFIGPKNLGKNNFAKEFAEFIGCKFPDLMLVRAGDGGEISIAKIREIQNFLSYKPYYRNFKTVVVDDAHSMNQEAQSCFLKTLEEPKGNTVIILISSRPDMLLPTIYSRCQIIKFFGKPVLSREKIEQENKILQEILKVSCSNLSEKFKYAKSLDFEQQNLGEILEVLQKYFRRQLLDAVSAGAPVSKLKKDIKLIEDINNKITFTNVNPKLALEVLLMNI
ncbi:MAG: DNA polymerase III subunit [Candidatus Staskawiczbacteria bacterium]|nr:DNA polymerase III subunit [Candidatus Staskawiczbacteria bacterium]